MTHHHQQQRSGRYYKWGFLYLGTPYGDLDLRKPCYYRPGLRCGVPDYLCYDCALVMGVPLAKMRKQIELTKLRLACRGILR